MVRLRKESHHVNPNQYRPERDADQRKARPQADAEHAGRAHCSYYRSQVTDGTLEILKLEREALQAIEARMSADQLGEAFREESPDEQFRPLARRTNLHVDEAA